MLTLPQLQAVIEQGFREGIFGQKGIKNYRLDEEQMGNLALAYDVASRRGISPVMLAGLYAGESRLRSASPRSSKGARGITQITSDTAKTYGFDIDRIEKDNAYALNATADILTHNIKKGLIKNNYSAGEVYFGGPGAAGKSFNNSKMPKTAEYARSMGRLEQLAQGDRSNITPDQYEKFDVDPSPLMLFAQERNQMIAALEQQAQKNQPEFLGALQVGYEPDDPLETLRGILGKMWDGIPYYNENGRRLSV